MKFEKSRSWRLPTERQQLADVETMEFIKMNLTFLSALKSKSISSGLLTG